MWPAADRQAIDPEILYRQFNYNFSSWKPEPHQADELDTIAKFSKHQSVFEIGCNDGLFMDKLRERGAKVLVGVEPNPVSGKIARERGIKVYSDMISPRCVTTPLPRPASSTSSSRARCWSTSSISRTSSTA